MSTNDFEVRPAQIREYAKKLLPRLKELLRLRTGIPVPDIDAISIAVKETTEREEEKNANI